ncbi:translational elongation factor EF-1 alpha, partial [Linnemannia elongata]
MSSESANTQILNELVKATQVQTTTDARRSQAAKVAEEVKNLGIIGAFRDGQLIKTITTLLDNKKQAPLRESAYLILSAVSHAVGQAGEPYLIPLVPKVLDGYADKVVSVRDTADEASKAIMALPSRYAVKLLLPVLFDSIENGRWQSQCGSLQLLAGLSKSSPKVRVEATKTTTACFDVVGNPDLIKSIPYLVGCINRPEEAPECIHQLASTTFVTTVEEPTLAIMCPLLVR